MSCVLLAVLLWLRRHRPRYDGFLIMLFAAWYGCQRIIEDFLREDKHLVGHPPPGVGLTGSQVTAIITVVVCLGHLLFIRHTPRWGNWDRVPEDTDGQETEEAAASMPIEAVDPIPVEPIEPIEVDPEEVEQE